MVPKTFREHLPSLAKIYQFGIQCGRSRYCNKQNDLLLVVLLSLLFTGFKCKHHSGASLSIKSCEVVHYLCSALKKWQLQWRTFALLCFLQLSALPCSVKLTGLVNVGKPLLLTKRHSSWLLVHQQHRMRMLQFLANVAPRLRKLNRIQPAYALLCFRTQLRALESTQKLQWQFPNVATLLIVLWVTSVEVGSQIPSVSSLLYFFLLPFSCFSQYQYDLLTTIVTV